MSKRAEGAGTTLSYNAALTLRAMAQGHGYGFEIMRATRLRSGTVYPLLRRLEKGGLVASRWEDEVHAHEDGRPRRRYYEVTPGGERALAVAVGRIADQLRLFGGGEAERPASA